MGLRIVQPETPIGAHLCNSEVQICSSGEYFNETLATGRQYLDNVLCQLRFSARIRKLWDFDRRMSSMGITKFWMISFHLVFLV
jgi:hypothetical protein